MYVLLGRNLWTCFAKDDPRAGLQVTETFAGFLIILCRTMMGWCRSEILYAKAKYQNLGCYISCLFVFNVCLWLEILSGQKKGTLDICPMYPGGQQPGQGSNLCKTAGHPEMRRAQSLNICPYFAEASCVPSKGYLDIHNKFVRPELAT